MLQLQVANEYALMGKISNNLELHGEEPVTAFAIPLEFTISREQLCALLGVYFDRALYNDEVGGQAAQPVEGFRHLKPLEISETLTAKRVVLRLDGDQELEFQDVKLQKLALELMTGGCTKVSVQVYVLPGVGKENLLLQEHQGRHIRVSISDTRIALKNGKQQDLPLNTVGDNEQPEAGAEKPAKKKRGRKSSKGDGAELH